MTKIFCLTGMHRSGTSLTSSYLEACGVVMGESMLPGNLGNQRGLFEDKEFVDFHRTLLKANYSFTFAPRKYLKVDKDARQAAKYIIEKRNKINGLWGWKDPRSTLFLDLWAESSDDIKFVFLYRDPYAVISSLSRRFMKFNSPKLYFSPWFGCYSWLQYNQRILDFFRRYPDRSLILSTEGFLKKPEPAGKLLTEWLQIEGGIAFSSVYHSDDMKHKSIGAEQTLFERYQRTVFSCFEKVLYETYSAVDEQAAVSSSGMK